MVDSGALDIVRQGSNSVLAGVRLVMTLEHKDIGTVKSKYSNKTVQQHEWERLLVIEWTHQQFRPCDYISK